MYEILLAVDNDESNAERAAEAVRSLPGHAEDVHVVLLNVFEEFDVTGEGGRVSSDDLFDPDDIPESVSVAVDVLEQSGLDADVRREHGDPAEQIIALADEIDADLIALSGRKRTPAGKALFGSVVQSVLLSADREVLVAMGD